MEINSATSTSSSLMGEIEIHINSFVVGYRLAAPSSFNLTLYSHFIKDKLI